MSEEKMILRDYLAADRTKMANERTLMAFLRTALVIFATAITILKLFPDDQILFVVGLLFLPISALVLFFGLRSYIKEIRTIKSYYHGDYFRDSD
jgi:putative membrane protein